MRRQPIITHSKGCSAAMSLFDPQKLSASNARRQVPPADPVDIFSPTRQGRRLATDCFTAVNPQENRSILPSYVCINNAIQRFHASSNPTSYQKNSVLRRAIGERGTGGGCYIGCSDTAATLITIELVLTSGTRCRGWPRLAMTKLITLADTSSLPLVPPHAALLVCCRLVSS